MNRAGDDGAAATDGMTIRVLGTLDVIADGGHRLALSSPKVRRLFAALLVDAGAVVSADRLADIIWGDEPPANTTGALHNRVSRLRLSHPGNRGSRSARETRRRPLVGPVGGLRDALPQGLERSDAVRG